MPNHRTEDIDAALKTAASEFQPSAWRSVETSVNPSDLHETVTVTDGDSRTGYSRGRLAQKLALASQTLGVLNKDPNPPRHAQVLNNILDQVERELTRMRGDGDMEINQHDLSLLLQKVMVDYQLHQLAELYVTVLSKPETSQSALRLIKRDGKGVGWDIRRVENAIRKAFLASKSDPEKATKVALAVEEKVLEIKRARIYLEEVQDLIQEELMRQGFFKQAELYILYRDAHKREREAKLVRKQTFALLKIKRHGKEISWDGIDLQKRVEYALIGLEVNIPAIQIEAHLRTSTYEGMDEKDLKDTVLLNAKTLVEKDADFAKFAGRIHQSYIYEEVLDWSAEADTFATVRGAQAHHFKKYIAHAIKIRLLNPDMAKYDLEKLAEALDPGADMALDFIGTETLYDRYLLVDKTGSKHRRIETIQIMLMRVAMGLFKNEPPGVREEKAIAYYRMVKDRRFMSSTPTLFNSGSLHSQLSSCYLYYTADSMEGIFGRGIYDNAMLSKWAGGLGGSWTAVRGTGAHIKGTNGESQGVIPFLKIHNDQLVAVNQGGRRKGTGCAYLETWHNDLPDFLELRKNTGDDRRRTHDMNTANWIPDLFMKRVEERTRMAKDNITDLTLGGTWTFFRSNEVPDLHELYGKKFEAAYIAYEAKAKKGEIYGLTVDALDVWKKMLSMLFETGHPWITFKDPSNIRSPQDHVGVVHSSNLCTEILLNTSDLETAVCNLASVIIDEHLTPDGKIDHPKLRATIRMAVEALDNVIDINFYPTEAAERSNKRHRPVGLGIMGLQNALYRKGLPFDSEEAMDFNSEMMEAIAYYAYEASSDLAAIRGTYETYKGSKWDRGILPQDTVDLLEKERGIRINVVRGGKMDWTPLRDKIAAQGMRNSNVLAIAPTATISNITNTSPCIEPTFKNIYVKSNLSGEFTVVNEFLIRELKKHNLWNDAMVTRLKSTSGSVLEIEEVPAEIKALFKTAFEIPMEAIINAAARRGVWIDQGQSVNLWYSGKDLAALSRAYRHAWHAGLKTTYYLRTKSASKAESAEAKENTPMFTAVIAPTAPKASAEQGQACSIEAMKNGEECEACQ